VDKAGKTLQFVHFGNGAKMR